jgi:hypothetical protein
MRRLPCLLSAALALGPVAPQARAEDPPPPGKQAADPGREAEVARAARLVGEGRILLEDLRYDEAIERFRNAADILRKERGPTAETADALAWLGAALVPAARPDEALPVNEEVLALR